MAREHELTRLAARQHGLASREQLLDLGFTDRQISGRVARGLWRRAAPRVYDIAPASADARRPLHAAVLASGGWASHRSAALLHGLIDEPPRVPQIIVGRNRTPKGLTAVVHRSTHVSYADLTVVDRIMCTTVLRTMLDLAGIVDDEALEHVVARGLTARKTTAPRLLRYVDSSFAGRRGGTALRAAASQYTRRRVETASRLEVIVNRLIRARAIAEPVRQYKVVLQGRVFFLDFAWPDELVFVEADGFRYHSTPLHLRRDGRRQNLLAIADWLPLRYTWADATEAADEIADEVREALTLRAHRR